MQFTNTIFTLAVALTAAAAPSPNGGGGGGGGSGGGSASCQNGNVYCCNSGVLGIIPINLSCVLSSLVGSACSNQICCTNSGSGSTTCINNSGVNIGIPILIDIL